MKVIITGATGMVGKGVLLECLESDRVESVLLVNRHSLTPAIDHPKLKEVLHGDFTNLEPIREALNGYDACFFCMGASAAGKSEEEYRRITFDIAREFAATLHDLNPSMVFNYVSGQGTDTTEGGSTMWARVKGKTENMILATGFQDAYMFRPGIILPERGIRSRTPLYNALYMLLRPFHGILKKRESVTTTTAVGRAMIHSVLSPQKKKILDGADINELAAKR